ncbi:MAG: molybdopterin-dependent oxidoreductase [Alphaproteobacteria bacterium]|nr:molybdopterin-dependent oxidoreductase [Alphaproteobacteria bacterium]
MFNRRSFLKMSALAASASVAGGATLSSAAELPIHGGVDFSPKTGKKREMVPSSCWQCVTRCPNVGYLEDGKLVKIEGHPKSIRTEGVMCAKGQGGINHITDPDRILYPMRRVGRRGEGEWKRVSWDEAIGELTERLKKLRDEGHPEKFAFHYGRMKSSSSKAIKAFLSNYGTASIGNHTSICESGKWTGQELTWGKHYDNWDFDNTKFVLNFGSSVLEAHTNHIPTAHRLLWAMADRGVRMVTFDVRLSNTAARSSEWVPVKPGTDRAVILAMCNVIMKEGLFKGEGAGFLKFVRATKNTNASLGDKVATLKTHLAPFSPEWAEKISGVPAKKIVEIAREFATTKPATLISYRGAVAHHHGADTERACQMLASITGNIDNPGGRLVAVGAKWKYPKGPKKKPKSRKLKIFDGPKGAAAFPTHHISHNVLEMIKDGSAGRPDIYMWYCYQPVYANGDVQKNIDILKDESLVPFLVCCSPHYDESAALADLILPDATYLERWDYEDMVSPTQVAEYAIRQPLGKPMGEVRDLSDVFCDIAKRLGFPLGFNSKKEFVQQACDMTSGIKKAGGFEFMRREGVWHDPKAKPKFYSYKKEISAKALKKAGVILDEETGVYWNWKKAKVKSEAEARKKGYTHTKKAYKSYVGQKIGDMVYKGFVPDKVNKTGFMELYSALMEEKGLNPLPTWTPIPEHERMTGKELILTTYKEPSQIHSRSQNCKWLTEITHENPGWINPETAASLGIRDGNRIEVKSAVGAIETTARVTPAVVPGVVAISHHCGHWEYGRYASGKRTPNSEGDADFARKWWQNSGVHPNWIIPNAPDPISGQMRWMDTVVKVTPV